MSKKKILIISDHALSPTGVGVQTKYLVEGLLKIGEYEILQLGAAIKHQNYNTVKVCEDFYIKPIDGFGNSNLLRSVLINEQPDALIIFSDPRFFEWLFKMEEEIHQFCPILWWHVWDNLPTPDFNEWMYDSIDKINCISYLTYTIVNKYKPLKSSFIPHTFPKDIFKEIKKDIIKKEKIRILGKKRKDNLVYLWMNRNCKRKRPADLLLSWSIFTKKLNELKNNVTLLIHSNPNDNAGCNLIEIAKKLNILDTISFSTETLSDESINLLHNISDVCVNISFNEGFGLTTLQSMQVGNPIIAVKTGGLYRQVINFKDKTENGIAVDIDCKTLSGNQDCHYIFEDYASCDNIANAFLKYYNFSKIEKEILSKKSKKYVQDEFNYNDMISAWHKSISEAIEEFKQKKSSVEIIKL